MKKKRSLINTEMTIEILTNFIDFLKIKIQLFIAMRTQIQLMFAFLLWVFSDTITVAQNGQFSVVVTPIVTKQDSAVTVCITICDSFNLCRKALIPVLISDCEDVLPPTIICPSPARVNIYGEILSDSSHFLQASSIADVCFSTNLRFGLPAATDDCGLFSVSQKSGLTSGSNFPSGIHSLLFEAMDKRGKTASCTTQIEVVKQRLIRNVSADSILLCIGSSRSFLSRDLGTSFYIWYGPNGFISANKQITLSNVSTAQSGKYILKVTRGTYTYIDSVYINVIGQPGLASDSSQKVGGYVTNVITPNGDGVNDALIIENYDPSVNRDSQITVYNKWGDAVFKAAPYLNDWTGTYGSKSLPDGTYYFVFLKSLDNKRIKDFVTIVR